MLVGSVIQCAREVFESRAPIPIHVERHCLMGPVDWTERIATSEAFLRPSNDRSPVILRVASGQIKCFEAAEILGMLDRSMRRVVDADGAREVRRANEMVLTVTTTVTVVWPAPIQRSRRRSAGRSRSSTSIANILHVFLARLRCHRYGATYSLISIQCRTGLPVESQPHSCWPDVHSSRRTDLPHCRSTERWN